MAISLPFRILEKIRFNSYGFDKNPAWVPGTQNGNFKVFDLNNDNELDLVLNGYNTDLDAVAQVYLNVNQTLELQYELPPVSDGKMAFADFNGDGIQDFVVSGQDENYDPYLAVYTNNGQGNFTEKIIEGEGLTGASIQTGDVNNDGFFECRL